MRSRENARENAREKAGDMDNRGKLGYRIVTTASLTAAAVGVALPLVPTVPFLLLAAWSASHHSPHLETRLLQHPVAGPHILAWRHERALSRRGKRGALIALVISYLIVLFTVPITWVKVVLGVCLAVGAVLIVTRPAPTANPVETTRGG